MLLPTHLLTLLATVCHSPTPSTSLRILLATDLTAHLPIYLLLMLIPFFRSHLVYVKHFIPNLRFTLPASTNRHDLHNNHRLCEEEARYGRFEGIFGGVATAGAGARDGPHAFVVVLICDEGNNVDEGFIVAFTALLGFWPRTEEDGYGMRMDDRGGLAVIVNTEVEKSRFGCIGHTAEFDCEF